MRIVAPTDDLRQVGQIGAFGIEAEMHRHADAREPQRDLEAPDL